MPHEWVIFDSKNLSKKEAQKREQELIKELRPKFNRKAGPNKLLNGNQIKQVKKLRLDKLSYNKIGEIVGCSRSTVYRIITNKRGIY